VLANAVNEWALLEPSSMRVDTQCWIRIVSGDFQYSCGNMEAALTKFLVRKCCGKRLVTPTPTLCVLAAFLWMSRTLWT
jgi:hypothetical protein